MGLYSLLPTITHTHTHTHTRTHTHTSVRSVSSSTSSSRVRQLKGHASPRFLPPVTPSPTPTLEDSSSLRAAAAALGLLLPSASMAGLVRSHTPHTHTHARTHTPELAKDDSSVLISSISQIGLCTYLYMSIHTQNMKHCMYTPTHTHMYKKHHTLSQSLIQVSSPHQLP